MQPDERHHRLAKANGWRLTDEKISPYKLAANGPTAPIRAWPLAERAVRFVDDLGPVAIAIEAENGDDDLRRLAELCRWLKVEAFAPPPPREAGERVFLVLVRHGTGEPKWVPNLRTRYTA